MKPTLVIGASTNPNRYSNIAIRRLREQKHPVYGLGREEGRVMDVELETEWNEFWPVDTVTLYINPSHQREYYKKILDLHPKRVIFNPGTENLEFEHLLAENHIKTEQACTLVLLNHDSY